MTETPLHPDRFAESGNADGPTTLHVVLSRLSVRIEARTPLAAPRTAVWRVLSDTAAYPSWNPFVIRFDGALALGHRVRVTLRPGAKAQTLRPRIVELEPGHGFSWLGRVGLPGVLDGRHRFWIEPDPGADESDPAAADRCVLVQQETLSGVLVPAFRAMLTRDAPRAFVALNEALAVRVRAESGPEGPAVATSEPAG